MNSLSLGSALVQVMNTGLSGHDADTFLAVFIALADVEHDVSPFSFASIGSHPIHFSSMALPKPWISILISTHQLSPVNRWSARSNASSKPFRLAVFNEITLNSNRINVANFQNLFPQILFSTHTHDKIKSEWNGRRCSMELTGRAH